MKKAITVLLIILIILPLCGCWDRREIGDLPIVMGFGIDKAEKPDKILITSQLANPSSSSASKGSKSSTSSSSFITITEEGDYVFPSVRKSALVAGKKLYISHTQVIVLGEDIAKEGISNYIDWFTRDHELRLEMYVLVADGTAKDILETPTDFQEVPAIHMSNLIKAQEDTSTGIVTDVLDFLDSFSSEKKSAVAPIIKVEDKMLKISGLAVFNHDKMVGTLTNEEGMGLLWGLNKFKKSVVVVSAEKSKVGIEILKSSTKITPHEDCSFEMDINIKANIGSERGSYDFASAEGTIILKKALAEKVESDIRKTLKRSSEFGTDIFGFSEIYYKKYPAQWEKHKNEFKNPNLKINVKSQILIAGRIKAPIH